jgi:transformation/transcription domain-associated protein
VRTAKEEFSVVKRRQMVGMNRMPFQQQQQLQQQLAQPQQQAPLPTEPLAPTALANQTGSEDIIMTESSAKPEQPSSTNAVAPPGPSSNPTQQPLTQPTLDPAVPPSIDRKPWDYIDEVVALLKTGHPLLALTLETIVDQMRDRLKADGDEELYRAICALQADALQVGSSSFHGARFL